MIKVTKEDLEKLSQGELIDQYLELQSELEVEQARHSFLGKLFVHNTKELIKYQQIEIERLSNYKYE